LVNRPVREGIHSPSSGAKRKNEWRYSTIPPPPVWLLGAVLGVRLGIVTKD
jgi:hypothetical protein